MATLPVPVATAVREASVALEAAGVASPRAEAQLLTAHVLGIARGRLALAPGLDAAALDRLRALVARRARRVPLQHLTGVAGFCRLELAVGPGVFIPRPETELLAQWAVGVAARLPPPVTVVDLGSGSGALALAIAQELPTARVYAVESAPGALRWLRRNVARRAAAGDRPVEVVAADAADLSVRPDLAGAVDLVVSNPPYVPEGTAVPPEVAGYDPPEAVFGGPDGLAVIEPLIVRAAGLLRAGGWFGMEHDETHATALPPRLDRWFSEIEDHQDLTGRPRYVTGRRVAD